MGTSNADLDLNDWEYGLLQSHAAQSDLCLVYRRPKDMESIIYKVSGTSFKASWLKSSLPNHEQHASECTHELYIRYTKRDVGDDDCKGNWRR